MRYETQKHPKDKNKYIVMDHGAQKALALTLPGHWVYLRLTERAEQIGGIYLPQRSRDEHVTLFEVIAIGNRVNTIRARQPKFKGVPDMERNQFLDIEVGDTVIIPEKATGEGTGYSYFVKQSEFSKYEGYVDAGLILAKVNG